MNRDHSVVFEIASKYHILDSFVDCDGYSTSSKGFLPTIVFIMVIWVKFTLQSILVRWFLKCQCSLLPSPVWPLQFALIHGPSIPGSYAVLLFTASDFTSITSHIYNWVLPLLWLHPFILSEVISPLISSSILGTYWPGEFLFQYPIILPSHTVHGFSRQEYWSGLPFPFQWTMFCQNCPSWPARLGWPYTAWLIVSLS